MISSLSNPLISKYPTTEGEDPEDEEDLPEEDDNDIYVDEEGYLDFSNKGSNQNRSHEIVNSRDDYDDIDADNDNNHNHNDNNNTLNLSSVMPSESMSVDPSGNSSNETSLSTFGDLTNSTNSNNFHNPYHYRPRYQSLADTPRQSINKKSSYSFNGPAPLYGYGHGLLGPTDGPLLSSKAKVKSKGKGMGRTWSADSIGAKSTSPTGITDPLGNLGARPFRKRVQTIFTITGTILILAVIGVVSLVLIPHSPSIAISNVSTSSISFHRFNRLIQLNLNISFQVQNHNYVPLTFKHFTLWAQTDVNTTIFPGVVPSVLFGGFDEAIQTYHYPQANEKVKFSWQLSITLNDQDFQNVDDVVRTVCGSGPGPGPVPVDVKVSRISFFGLASVNFLSMNSDLIIEPFTLPLPC